ncbi:hypothetical protein LTR36_001619 [Oleoguttula mirabilis]|uniref:Mitochondrial outer membrane protein n=1 Tax=Oleoguttula mirabilis TaxID=1507867 RepID=A0AAV9JMV8_9PEZI|nr:hypothetical protein LTR36_001619 [Oleoguttula mirabilis]
MLNDDPPPARNSSDQRLDASSRAQKPTTDKPSRSFFTIPPPVKRIFDKFPLVTYAENELPSRAPKERGKHVLHIFTSEEDARKGRPSFNPACVKWQAYMKFNGIDVSVVPSSNHASPSGALPFLLPAVAASAKDPVPSNKLRKWVLSQKGAEKAQESEDIRYEAYASLLDTRIRKAWLFQLYLNPANNALLQRLYIAPCSSNPFVRMTIAYQLRQAAETELVKSSASDRLVEDDIMRDAEGAFEALATLLGEDEWFFGQEQPGLFDASVFAYTHLLLDDGMPWQENKLAEMARRHGSLVRHQERIAMLYF